MRSLFLTAAAVALAAPVAIHAQEAKFSTNTTIADLVANAEAKAVLETHMPQIIQVAPQMGTQTLRGLQAMAPDRLTDELLGKIDADLAKIK